jgi:hypothetical protein
MDKCNCCHFYELIERSRNHLVLDADKVYRLLGITEDEDDYYWIYEDLHGKVSYASCVGGWTDLTHVLNHATYRHLDRLFIMNHTPPEKDPDKDVTYDLLNSCYCEKLLEQHIQSQKSSTEIINLMRAQGQDPKSFEYRIDSKSELLEIAKKIAGLFVPDLMHDSIAVDRLKNAEKILEELVKKTPSGEGV